MPERFHSKVTSIVKTKLNSGLISVYDDLAKVYYAEADDMINIIEAVEHEFNVEFDDAEHFRCKSINDICKILATKNIDDSWIMSFGGEHEPM